MPIFSRVASILVVIAGSITFMKAYAGLFVKVMKVMDNLPSSHFPSLQLLAATCCHYFTPASSVVCPMRGMRLPRAHGAMAIAAMALAKGTKKGRSEGRSDEAGDFSKPCKLT